MITLQNKLYESLLDDEDDLVNDEIALIEQFLKDNYNIKGTYTIDNRTVNINGDIFVENNNLKQLTNGLFKFGKVSGIFSCQMNEKLTSLEGGPSEVGGSFICGYCRKLTSLEGGPEKVGKVFSCAGCDIINLNGSPKIVKDFNCSNCNKLTSLEGGPSEVGGSFICNDCKNLKTLKGLPKIVKSDFQCKRCPKLDSVQLAYKVTKGNVYS